MPLQFAIPNEIRKLLQFGSGVGIEIGAKDLEVAVVRVRPTGVRVLGRTTVKDYASRAAAEWGAEYSAFLKSLGVRNLSAAALLPRRDVIVRQIPLPGVAAGDMESAIRLQLDSLHPFGEDEAAWGWSPAGRGAALVGIARTAVVERYAQLFTEAGIAVWSFTFSGAALHAAVSLNAVDRGAGFIALGQAGSGAVEAYGESASRAVFSAEFQGQPERAAAMAISELRLPPETVPLRLDEALPKPDPNPVENDLSRNALPYATALAGACPLLAPAANLLPAERRRYGSRVTLAPTVALAVLLIAIFAGSAVWSGMSRRRYLDRLHQETSKLQPLGTRAASLRAQADQARVRVRWLDGYRGQTRRDLDLLNDLTRLMQPPAWTNSLAITHDTARLQGEAPQATALWKILDSSHVFASSSLNYNQPASGGGENFLITGNREAGK